MEFDKSLDSCILFESVAKGDFSEKNLHLPVINSISQGITCNIFPILDELSYLGPRCPKNYGPSCLGPRFCWAEWSGPSCLWVELSVIRMLYLVCIFRL